MNVIGCLDEPTGGRYLLEGIDVSHRGRDELAEIRNKKIGFVFQGFNLLARTSALENVELPLFYNRDNHASDRRRAAIEALNRVGLGDRLDHTPSQLSGGQQQRVAVARALANEPSIVLADEPSGNLDDRASENLHSLVRELSRSQKQTFIIVTHKKELLEKADRGFVLADGTLHEIGRGADALPVL
jgi:putative ABC transport system ATP-binding protein